MKTITKPSGQTWDNYINSIQDPILKAAIECYIAIWYPYHNQESTIEVSEFTGDSNDESEEEINRWR